jgi:hypothetical protein
MRAPHQVPKYRSYESLDLAAAPSNIHNIYGEFLASSKVEHGKKKVVFRKPTG